VPTIALITTDPASLPTPEPDTADLAAALRSSGLEADVVVWHDPAVDWARYDLAVIRTPWDYPERHAEFMAWLDRAAAATRLLNAPDLIRWNIDKRYLTALAESGLPVVPTEFCDTVAAARTALDGSSGRVVVKPSVSAGSRDTGLFTPDDPKALDLARKIIDSGKTAMVQPAVEEIIERGELGLFYFNGEYTSAFHKGPILAPGGAYVGNGDLITLGSPSPEDITLGSQALAAVTSLGFDQPLYARIDIAAAQVIEVEVFEPGYALPILPANRDAFVQAVHARLA
jgi:glutathione synthase/RimK-type ligase-like ATP-grasp enzyme